MKKAKRILDENVFKLIESGSEQNLNIAKELCIGIYQDENYFWDALAIVLTEAGEKGECKFIRINKSISIQVVDYYNKISIYVEKVETQPYYSRKRSYSIHEAKDLVNEIRAMITKLKKMLPKL